MSENQKAAIAVPVAMWLMLCSFECIEGSNDRTDGYDFRPQRRYDILFPGYRIGYWLAGPVK